MQAYFHYFRCKRVFLDSLRSRQWDKALLEEAYAAFTRARFKFYQDTGRKWEPYEDGIDVNRIPDDSDNLIYIEWSGGDTGAIPSWYENTFEMGLYDEYVSPWKMDFEDLVSLSYACTQVWYEDMWLSCRADAEVAAEYLPAKYIPEDEDELYGFGYCRELEYAIHCLKRCFHETNFDEEVVIVLAVVPDNIELEDKNSKIKFNEYMIYKEETDD